jgi:hypothetical protein
MKAQDKKKGTIALPLLEAAVLGSEPIAIEERERI